MNKTIEDFLEYKYTSGQTAEAADRILKLKKTKPMWEVIGEIIKFWASANPSEYQSFLIEIEETKRSRKETTVGSKSFSGVSKKGGSYINYMLDIPVRVYNIIRIVYTADELKMDKKFFRQFMRKFPAFKISQKKG